MSDIFIDSQNKNKKFSSSNNISDNTNNELNELKSYNYKVDEVQNNFNEDSLNKNQISDEKTNSELNDKLIYENEENKFDILIRKYKQIEEENKKLNNQIKKETLIIEEQNNTILLLKSSIENDFFKNNDMKKYITKENIIDFIKLKTENEQYKKELVLSQALINSLQAENLRLIKSKEENSDLINIETDDFLSNSEHKIYDINSNQENEIINELNKENNILKKLIQEATSKLNYLLINEKNTKILSEDKNILSLQIKEKNEIINKYEEKLSFFNSYIIQIKSSFNKIKQCIINTIKSYNKIANEDLNSLLSNNFSQNISKLNMLITNIDDIEQYNLETQPELDLHNAIYELITSINEEFIILYEKVFQTNNYYKESNEKVNELEFQLKEFNNNSISNNKLNKLKDEYVKTIIKLNLEISEKESDNFFLKENSDFLKKDLNDIIDVLSAITHIFKNNNEIQIIKYLNIFLENEKEKLNLILEKEKTINKIQKNNHKIKNLKLENKNVNNIKFYDEEYINDIINDFQNKINEKKNQLDKIKKQIFSMLY